MDSSQVFSTPRLEINLLGRFEVFIDKKNLPESEISGRKARTLLKLLAHQRHFQMVRDQAVDVLWPDLKVEAASAQLYKAIHNIRKAFAGHAEDGGDWLVVTDNLIRLVPPAGLVTDLQQFEQAAREGLRDKQISNLERAVSTYAGDFLPMDRYAEWATNPREHYRQMYLDVLSALAEQYEQRGDLSEAAEMFRLTIDKEPTFETAHHGLMRIFARKGQPTRAFHQYEQCRVELKEELGMSPAPETRNTLDDIREGRFPEQQQLDAEREAPRATVPGPATPVIGRNEVLAVLDQLLEDLSHGKGGTLVINGEAGTGKTRLVRELTRRTLHKEIPCFLGRTGENTGTVAYGPFVELINDMLHRRPDLEADLPSEFGELLPFYSGEGIPLPHADKLAAKGYLFAKIHRFINNFTENEPAVIILEDLHAADQGTLDLFSYLFRYRAELPVLFVVTKRIETHGSAVKTDFITGLDNESAKVVNLEPLTYEETLHLLHQNAETASLSTDVTNRICELSEGNPLFALELLRHHTENLTNTSNTRHKSGFAPHFPLYDDIPDTLRHLVDQKLEKLSPVAHHLLYIAAVIGRRVPFELLASIWNDGERNQEKELFNALEEVVHSRLLEEHGLDYAFRHALVREAIYAGISEARRRTLHSLVALRMIEMFEGTDSEPVDQIASHFLQAGETLRGAEYLVKAGARAEAAYAHEDALQRYLEVCEVLDTLDDESAQRLKCKTLESTGDVYCACGSHEMSCSAYEEAIALAEEIPMGDQEQLMELHRKVAVVAIMRTEMDRSKRYLGKAFELASDNPRVQARLAITQALHWWHLNRLEEAYDIAQKALKQARLAEAKAEASQACEILAMTCLPLGRWEEGLKYEMEKQIYGWSPEVAVATDAHLCLWEYHVSGDQPLQQARLFMEQVSRQASKLGDLRCVAVCHYALGTMHLWRGLRDRAVNDLSSSMELHERVGSPAGMAYALARKGGLHTMMGAIGLGWQAVNDGLAYAEQAAVRDHCQQRLYGVGIWNRLEADELSQARELVEKSEKLLKETGACAACALDLYPWLAYYYLQTGDTEQVKACDKAVSNLAKQTGNPIGNAIASMIASSLCIIHQDEQKAQQHKLESYQILQEAVPESSHSPVGYFLDRMSEQQSLLPCKR